MKSRTILLTIWLMWCFGLAPVHGQEEMEEAQQQEPAAAEVEESAQQIDEQASTAEGAGVVEQRIKDRFNVDDTTIKNLREKGLGYGEITTALSLADRLEGGLTEENIQKITDMRIGDNKRGWGEIAKSYDVTVGELKRPVQDVQGNAPDPAIQDHPAKGARTEPPARYRSDRPDHPSHPGKNK